MLLPRLAPVASPDRSLRRGALLVPRLLVLLFALGLASCPDPVREDLEADQGPEQPGVPEGPLHRAGQRCLACHRDGGPSPPFSVAGTIFRREGAREAAPAIEVVVRDARGEQQTFVTNEVGNFWALQTSWSPVFPLRAELHVNGRTIAMRTEIPREGSCNACHRAPSDTHHMPGVFVEAAR
jgi:hypothetical protein